MTTRKIKYYRYNIKGGNKKMINDDYEDFKNYVMYCVDAEDFPPDAYSCEDICKTCKYFELFSEYCPCALNISCTGYDDKGNKIVVSCGSYDKKQKY